QARQETTRTNPGRTQGDALGSAGQARRPDRPGTGMAIDDPRCGVTAMALTTPEWLARRGGELREDVAGRSWVVYFDGQPQYVLTPVPVAGKHGCHVMQSINGKSFACTGTFASPVEAVSGGLEDLRRVLGW